MAKKQKNWIQKAIKKPGALRDYVQREYGKAGFTKDGAIKPSVLQELAQKEGTIGKRARLAITLKKLGKKK